MRRQARGTSRKPVFDGTSWKNAGFGVLRPNPRATGTCFAKCFTANRKGRSAKTKEPTMIERRKSIFALYVDRSTHQWIVLDRDGNFWIVPSEDENPWNQRQPFTPTEETELEAVPGYYKDMLGVPT
jgi:hypothetical protein